MADYRDKSQDKQPQEDQRPKDQPQDAPQEENPPAEPQPPESGNQVESVPNTSAAEQHAPVMQTDENKTAMERFAYAGLSRFTRYGQVWEVHATLDSGCVLVTNVDNAEPKSPSVLKAPEASEAYAEPEA